MKEYSFAGNITMPDGTEMIEAGTKISLYKVLGNILMGKTEGVEPFKAIGWATELTKEPRTISMDDTDKEKLLAAIKNSDVAKNSGIGNLLVTNLSAPLKS